MVEVPCLMRAARPRTLVPALISLAACALVVAGCSTQPAAGPSVPAYTPQASESAADAQSPSPTPAATPSQVPLEPEALSDPQTGYLVAELPPGLDEQSQAILRGYLAYDRATWDAFRTMDGDLSKVEQSSTDSAWTSYREAYERTRSKGQRVTGSVTLYVKAVTPSLEGLATVDICTNQTGIVFLDSAGTEIAKPTLQVEQRKVYTMVNYGDTWKVSEWHKTGVTPC